jgi:hypothetical protein
MADNREKICLILGSHAHVPHGAPEHEFERICETVLKPFVLNLYKYPRIQATLHYSGVLLYWMERVHHELFMLIEDMVSRRQVEILGGGFYEPMLPLLSSQDKIGQIELLTTYLRRQFGRRPQGCWIPAWEQNLIGPLAACGMAYTFLDEEQFTSAGVKDIYSPCLTEDQGKIVTVFPIFRSLEKKLAEKNAQAFFGELRESLPEESEPIISVFPRQIYTSAGEAADYAWNRFFEEISLSESIVECASPAKIIKGLKGLKKACFSDSCQNPRRFLISHPEANGIYSKMIFTSLLINQLRGDKSRKQNARQELWKAQGCDLFSSEERLYDHSLRKAAYRSLLGAEQITREKTKFAPSLIQFDFDFDGTGEFLFQDQKLNCYIQTLGAGIFELDYMPKIWNYLDTCNFCGSPNAIPAKRIAFADSLLPPDADCGKLLNDDFQGGRCCAGKQYLVKELDRVKRKVSFSLPPEEGSPFGSIGIKKTFSQKKDTLSVSYILQNHGSVRTGFQFAPQIDLCFYGEDESFVRIYSYKTGAKDTPVSEPPVRGAEGLKIQDIKNETLITFASTNSFDARVLPRRVKYAGAALYQSTAIIPFFALSLEAGESWANEFSLKFAH